jgi:RNA polymerase sigma factor (sigma-70 family)
MGALSKDRRGQLNALIKSEMDRRNDERAGQMRLFSQRAYHGTPHDWAPETRYRLPDGSTRWIVDGQEAVPEGAVAIERAPAGRARADKVFTGEGGAAYGTGVLYLAEARETGINYRDSLQPKSPFKVNGKELDELANEIGVAASYHVWDAIQWGDGNLASARKTIGRWLKDPSMEMDGLKEAQVFLSKLKQQDITKKKSNLYTIEIDAKPEDFLDWDKPLSEQSEKVKEALRAFRNEKYDLNPDDGTDAETGATAYERISDAIGTRDAASKALLAAGIPGIRYLDGNSRTNLPRWGVKDADGNPVGMFRSKQRAEQAAAERPGSQIIDNGESGTYNYVIFDEALIRVVEKNGEPIRAQAAQTLPDLTPEARESIVRRATQSLNAAAPDSVLGAGKQGASAGMDGRGPNMARVGVARNTPHGNQARSAVNAAITDTRKAAESLGYGLRILDPTSVSDAQIKIDLKDSKARFSLAEGRILLVENFVDALPGVEAARRYLREELIHAAQLRVVDPAGSATTREAREALLLPVVNDIATELLQTEQGRGLLAASIGIYDGTKTIDPRLVEENIDGLSILELWRQLHQLRERSGLTEAGLNRVYKRIRQWMEQALRVLRKAAKQSPSPILDEAVQATVDLLNGRDSILSSQQPLTEQQVAGLSQRYNELFRMQRDGERLTPAQQRAMDQAEEALGQQLLFDIERLKGFAPAEQLTLQQQVDDTRVPSPDQLSLFSQKSAEREAAAGQMLLDFAQQQQETTTQANLTPEQTRLVTANMGIAGHAARRAALFYGWDRDDAMQEASIALAQAALTYDPARGARFSTYAFKVIANRLTSIGRGKGARAASNRAVRSISLNAPIAADDDTGLTRQDTIAGTVQPNETPERDEARALIAEAMAGVKPTARDILTRYAQGQTYDQIASDIGMTRQGVMMQAGRTADRLRRFFAERGVRSMDDLLPPQQERETPEAARKATPEDEQDTNMLDAREPDPERTTETQDDTDEALNSQPPARTVTADTARADLGRSHPSDERILTATGEMRTVADMAPQHKLSGSTGPTTITAVYPQADDQDVYTITTDGGRSVRASLDHLWLVLDTATGRTDTVTTMGLEPGRHMLPVIAR